MFAQDDFCVSSETENEVETPSASPGPVERPASMNTGRDNILDHEKTTDDLSEGVKSISDLFKIKMLFSPSFLTKNEKETLEESVGGNVPHTSNTLVGHPCYVYNNAGAVDRNPTSFQCLPSEEVFDNDISTTSNAFYQYGAPQYQMFSDSSENSDCLFTPETNRVEDTFDLPNNILSGTQVAFDRSVVDLAVQLANFGLGNERGYVSRHCLLGTSSCSSLHAYFLEESVLKKRQDYKVYKPKRPSGNYSSLPVSAMTKNSVNNRPMNHFKGGKAFRSMNWWENTWKWEHTPSASSSKVTVKGNYESTSDPKSKGRDIKGVTGKITPSRAGRSRKSRRLSSNSSSSGGQTKKTECVLCKTNGETAAMYRSHILKNDLGQTTCHVLQKYICPCCGATGKNAHTLKYCPINKQPPSLATMKTLKSMRLSTGKLRLGSASLENPQAPPQAVSRK